MTALTFYRDSSLIKTAGANIAFICQGEIIIYFHRILLHQASEVFQTMLDGPMIEATTGIIRVDRSAAAMADVLWLIEHRDLHSQHSRDDDTLYEIYDIINEYQLTAYLPYMGILITTTVTFDENLLAFARLYDVGWETLARRWMELPETTQAQLAPLDLVLVGKIDLRQEVTILTYWEKVIRWVRVEDAGDIIDGFGSFLQTTPHTIPSPETVTPEGPIRNLFLAMVDQLRSFYAKMEETHSLNLVDGTIDTIERKWANDESWLFTKANHRIMVERRNGRLQYEAHQLREAQAREVARLAKIQADQEKAEAFERYNHEMVCCCWIRLYRKHRTEELNTDMCGLACGLIILIVGGFIAIWYGIDEIIKHPNTSNLIGIPSLMIIGLTMIGCCCRICCCFPLLKFEEAEPIYHAWCRKEEDFEAV